jgi:transcriptional regulator with XRE-family HTH domain
MEKFKDWLEEEMAARQWRSADLARAAGLTDSTISRILSGKQKPTPDFCNAIAQALAEPPETVFRRAGLLPPLPGPEENLTLQQIYETAKLLSPAQRDELLEYILFRVQRSQKPSSDVGKEAPSQSPLTQS